MLYRLTRRVSSFATLMHMLRGACFTLAARIVLGVPLDVQASTPPRDNQEKETKTDTQRNLNPRTYNLQIRIPQP